MALAQFLLSMVPDTSGNPLSAGKLYFYEVGTTDPKTVYSGDDENSDDALSQPIVLDGAGTRRSNPVYFSGKAKLDIYDADDTLIASIPVVGTSLYAQDVLIDQTLSGGAHNDFSLTNVDAVLALAEDSFGAADWEYQSTRSTNTYASAVEVKLRRVIDLADYYDTDAVPSTFDDALDNAIADLGSGGGGIFFPAGTYRINTVIVVDDLTNIHFFGEGKSSIITQNTAAAGENVMFDITGTSSGIHFSDLQLQGTGTSSTTASIGIETENTCSDIRIERVYFSGTESSKGFNKAVYSLAARTKIAHSYFDYMQNTSSGYGIDLGSGADDSRISHCYIDNSDGVCAYGIRVASCDRAQVIGTTVKEATSDGITLILADDTIVSACHVADCTSAGIHVAGCNNVVMSKTTSKGNTTYGLQLGNQSTTPCAGGVYSDNILTGNTLNGIITQNGSSDASTSTGITFRGNRIAGNSQTGMIVTTNDCIYDGNILYSNSAGSSATYPAIHVTTLGAHYGGERNFFTSNIARDASGSRHSSCIKIADSTGSAVNNVITTTVTGNDFPPQNSDGTPLIWEYGVADTSPPGMRNNIAGNSDGGPGDRQPWKILTGDTAAGHTLTVDESGMRILLDLTGSSGTVTITLPDIGTAAADYRNGVWYDIQVIVGHATSDVDIVRSATNLIFMSDAAGAATITQAAGANLYGALRIRGVSDGAKWFAWPPGATGNSTNNWS